METLTLAFPSELMMQWYPYNKLTTKKWVQSGHSSNFFLGYSLERYYYKHIAVVAFQWATIRWHCVLVYLPQNHVS